MDKKQYGYWRDRDLFDNTSRKTERLHVSFAPSTTNIIQLKTKYPKVKELNFTPATMKFLSKKTRELIEFLEIEISEGYLSEVKYGAEVRDYSIFLHDKEQLTCAEIARKIKEKFEVNVTRGIIHYWVNGGRNRRQSRCS